MQCPHCAHPDSLFYDTSHGVQRATKPKHSLQESLSLAGESRQRAPNAKHNAGKTFTT